MRLDVWLWAARFYKTRALAKAAIQAGHVEVDGQVCKPARLLRVGSTVALRRGDEDWIVEVLALSDRRGPAGQAQQLYRETAASQAARLAEQQRRRLERSHLDHPGRRPERDQRRALLRLRAQSAGSAAFED